MAQSLAEKAKLRSGLTEFFGSVEALDTYEACKSDGERINFVYHCPMIHTLFKSQWASMKQGDNNNLKSNKESKRLRDLGNAAFRSARDLKALELYSEAVVCAEQPYYVNTRDQENCFALAVANRSAVQVRLDGRWVSLALEDINMALEAGHPNPTKLLERKAACLAKLQQFPQAVKAMETALNTFNASKEGLSPEKRAELEMKIQEWKTAENSKDTNATIDDDVERGETFTPNPLCPALSSAVETRYEDSRGRFGVASRDIALGETLLVEDATSARIKKQYLSDHCDNCLRYCQGYQMPCLRCTTVRFCSKECMEQAEATYHPFECSAKAANAVKFFEDFLVKLKGVDGAIGYYILLYRLVCRKPLEFFVRNRHWMENPDEKLVPASQGRDPVEDSYCRLFSLVRHSNNDSTSGLFWIVLSAVFHVRSLQLTGYFGPDREKSRPDVALNKDEIYIGSLMVYLLQILRYNTHSVIEQVCPESSSNWAEWKPRLVATAIFPHLALLNHSCDPNIGKYFVGAKVVAVANRNIYKGEEVTENYHPFYALMEKRQRQQFLSNHYCFTCTCLACINDYPLRKNFTSCPKFLCTNCHQILRKDSFCDNCNLHVDVATLKDQLELYSGKVEEVKKNVANLSGSDLKGGPLEKQLNCLQDICTSICTLVEPSSELVLTGRDFYSALLAKLKGNVVQYV